MKRQISLIISIIIGVHLCAQTNTVKIKKHNNIKKSSVVYFNYKGLIDTTCAIVNGKVYELGALNNFKDSLRPLINVKVKVEQNNQAISTNKNGEFIIGVQNGVFTLLIEKEGYEPLRISNYASVSGRISFTKIILVKGKDLQTFEIPNSSQRWFR
ncbi:MAG: hypothetical protein V4547_10290 [Bacteroidota bacterium]